MSKTGVRFRSLLHLSALAPLYLFTPLRGQPCLLGLLFDSYAKDPIPDPPRQGQDQSSRPGGKSPRLWFTHLSFVRETYHSSSLRKSLPRLSSPSEHSYLSGALRSNHFTCRLSLTIIFSLPMLLEFNLSP